MKIEDSEARAATGIIKRKPEKKSRDPYSEQTEKKGVDDPELHDPDNGDAICKSGFKPGKKRYARYEKFESVYGDGKEDKGRFINDCPPWCMIIY